MAETPGGISRRRVLAGTAWATPAIVLAVAVPQAAASEGSNVVPVSGVMIFTNVTVSNGTNGVVEVTFAYGLNWTANFPPGALATTHWQITANGPGGPYVSPVGTQMLGNSQYTPQLQHVFTGVAPGLYTVTAHIWGQVYDPDTDITYTSDATYEPPPTITVT